MLRYPATSPLFSAVVTNGRPSSDFAKSAILSPLQLVGMSSLLTATSGSKEIVIGMIDGPVASSHPDLQGANLRTLSSAQAACRVTDSLACQHGTFIAGILSAQRDSQAPAICPGCPLLVRPIFCEVNAPGQYCPEVTPSDLASAITEVVQAGAKLVNLSLGLTTSALQDHHDLTEAFNYAQSKGVLIVSAAGNQGRIGRVPLFDHPWIIPVAACDLRGQIVAGSNIGAAVGKRGLLSPGVGVTSLSSNGGHTRMDGTSVATPFVTGALALLWSLVPQATAVQMRKTVLLPGMRRQTIIPPLLNAEASWRALMPNP